MVPSERDVADNVNEVASSDHFDCGDEDGPSVGEDVLPETNSSVVILPCHSSMCWNQPTVGFLGHSSLIRPSVLLALPLFLLP